MTTQPTRPTGGPGSHAPAPFRATRTATGVRGRAVLAALGLALAAAVLPATAVHASPQPPDIDHRFANPGGNPQPPEPPDPPQWGPQDLVSPTEDPEPPLPPEPPDNGPDDEANPVANPEPHLTRRQPDPDRAAHRRRLRRHRCRRPTRRLPGPHRHRPRPRRPVDC